MAKGIKTLPYSNEEQEFDIQEFHERLELCCDLKYDPRVQDNLSYNFVSVVGIILCAVIAGANTISGITNYAEAKFKWLKTWLEIPDTPPGYMVFWWMLVRLDPKYTEQVFRDWVAKLNPKELQEIISIDGKRIKGASKKKSSKSLIHIVSAWSSTRGLILGQVKTAEKSNEITAIPELIEGLDISGAVITIDAMGTQKNIAKKIKDQGGDYILALKGNQERICDEVENFFTQAYAIKFEGVNFDSDFSKNCSHGRIEEREVFVSNEIDWLPMKDDWSGLQSLVMILSRRTNNGSTSTERRLFISSLEPNAKLFNKAIRMHWGIENKVHWVLDVNFREDESQIHTGHAAENLSIMKRLSINILRLSEDEKTSLAGRRRKAGWNNQYMAQLLYNASIKSF
jgi:predicted transposase YbfD/YdcC